MLGVALEGGGAKGAYHIGALRALEALGLVPEVVAGTSIGAINGALYVSGSLDLLEEIWRTATIADMVCGDPEMVKRVVNFDFKSDYSKIRTFVIDTLRQGGLDVTPYKERLKGILSEEAVRNSPLDFGLVTLSLTDLKPIECFIEAIPPGKLYDYIVASANFPAFKSERLDNKKMLDGAFFDNLPVNMLLRRGCERVIAIRLYGMGRIRKLKNPKNVPITYITPSEDLGKTLGLDPQRAAYNIDMGYYDTLRTIKGYAGTMYTITDRPSDAFVVGRLNRIGDEGIGAVGKLMDVEKPPKRLLFEDLLPLLTELLKVPKDQSYFELILSFYEYLAYRIKLPRFQLWTFDAFVGAVNAAYDDLKKEEGDLAEVARHAVALLPNKSLTLLPFKVKDRLLVQMYYTLRDNGFETGTT